MIPRGQLVLWFFVICSHGGCKQASQPPLAPFIDESVAGVSIATNVVDLQKIKWRSIGRVDLTQDVSEWVLIPQETEDAVIAFVPNNPQEVFALTTPRSPSSPSSSSSLSKKTQSPKRDLRSISSTAVVQVRDQREPSREVREKLAPYEMIFAIEDTDTAGGKGYQRGEFSSEVELVRVLTAFSMQGKMDFGFDVVTTSNLGGLDDKSQQGDMSVGSIVDRVEKKERYSVVIQQPERSHWVGVHKAGQQVYVFDSLGKSAQTLKVGFGFDVSGSLRQTAIETARKASLSGKSADEALIDGVNVAQMSMLIRQWNLTHMIERISANRQVIWIDKAHQTQDAWTCGYHQIEAAYRNAYGLDLDLNQQSQDSRFFNDFIGPGRQYEQIATAVETLRTAPEVVQVQNVIREDSSGIEEKIGTTQWKNLAQPAKRKPLWIKTLMVFGGVVGGAAAIYAMMDVWLNLQGDIGQFQETESMQDAKKQKTPLVWVRREKDGLVGYVSQENVEIVVQPIGSLRYP